MRINEVVYTDAEPIDGYGAGFFRIGGRVHQGAMIASPSGTKPWGGLDDRQALLAMADEIDVLFVGTGTEIVHLPADLRMALEEAGIGVETMNSPAACRTYNVLLAEGRRVAIAAIPV